MKKMQRVITCISLLMLICLSCGCEKISLQVDQSFQDYYKETRQDVGSAEQGMARDLAVITPEEEESLGVNSQNYAELLINDSSGEVLSSYQCFQKNYPASITKIMTALLTLEKGNLSDEITLDHDIVLNEDGAVISTLTKGNIVTVESVLKTMLVKSANDCSIILAEYIAGSTDEFVEMMNERAVSLGATHTHFVNPNGLHDDEHYTTAYDLYLIFKEVIKHDTFVDIVSMKDYTMTYTNMYGQEVSEYMQSTNHFLLNEYSLPEGVVMFGGKTGTTSMAKSCLILMTENADGERFFSVILGAETKDVLYQDMAELLELTTK